MISNLKLRSRHAIIFKNSLQKPHNSAGIIGLDRFDWLFLVWAALLGFSVLWSAHQMNAAMPKSPAGWKISIYLNWPGHISIWLTGRWLASLVGVSNLRPTAAGSAMWPIHYYAAAANWNVSWCPRRRSRILLRQRLTAIRGDTNSVGKPPDGKEKKLHQL